MIFRWCLSCRLRRRLASVRSPSWIMSSTHSTEVGCMTLRDAAISGDRRCSCRHWDSLCVPVHAALCDVLPSDFFFCSAVTFPSSSTSSRRPEEVTLTCAPMGTPISESTQTQSPFHFNRKKNNRKRCIDIHSQLLLGYSFYEGDISMFSFSQVMIFPFIESQTRQRNDQGRLYDRQISRVLQTYPSQHHHNTAFLHNENKKQENSQFVEPPSVFHRLCCTS